MTARTLPPLPTFESEAEEAKWWFEHRDALSEDILSAAESGALGEGSLGRAKRVGKRQAAEKSAA